MHEYCYPWSYFFGISFFANMACLVVVVASEEVLRMEDSRALEYLMGDLRQHHPQARLKAAALPAT
jgi:hypothetical protein